MWDAIRNIDSYCWGVLALLVAWVLVWVLGATDEDEEPTEGRE